MGSGLILLVIVGAWLAVLVPMALRSYDTSSTIRVVERVGDAARELSRRAGEAGRSAAGRVPRRNAGSGAGRLTSGVVPPPPVEPLLHRFRDDPPRRPLSPVARRRRVLLSLLIGAAAFLLLGGLLSAWLLVPGGVLLVLAFAYVAHLRRLEVRRAERQVRDAGRPAVQPAAGRRAPSVTAGAGPRSGSAPVPPRPAATVPVPERAPLPAAVGSEWSPVPVPPPMYVTAPAAPPRPARTVDRPDPARRGATTAAGRGGPSEDLELDSILDGRRAVGNW